MSYSDTELLQALQECKKKHGEVTTTVLNEDDDFPSGPTYGYRFESLIDALERANLEEEAEKARGRSRRTRGGWDRDEIITKIESVAEGGKITSKMIDSSDAPSITTIQNNLDIDSIDELPKVVDGIEFTTEREMSISSRDVVENGLYMADAENDYITYSILEGNDDYPTKREVTYHFNGLKNASKELDIELQQDNTTDITDFTTGSYIYILELKDNSYQIGSTTEPSNAVRLLQQDKSIVRIHSLVAVDSELYDVEKELVEQVADITSWDDVRGKLSENRVKIECDNCGDVFSRTECKVNETKNFCTRDCNKEYNREERTCVVCGETKSVQPSAHEHKNGWVCSDECNKKNYRNTIECVVCGSEKEELKSTTEKRKLPYRCSDECMKEWAYIETDCTNCGETFSCDRSQYKRYDNNYCSGECVSESMKSEDAYNKRKHKKWAKKVKDRENNTCEECGESYDVMTAHHNPPKDELPEDRKYDTDVGMCLCYPCHADQHTGTQRTALLSWWQWYISDE